MTTHLNVVGRKEEMKKIVKEAILDATNEMHDSEVIIGYWLVSDYGAHEYYAIIKSIICGDDGKLLEKLDPKIAVNVLVSLDNINRGFSEYPAYIKKFVLKSLHSNDTKEVALVLLDGSPIDYLMDAVNVRDNVVNIKNASKMYLITSIVNKCALYIHEYEEYYQSMNNN